jgi:alpha-methylacyl-CoA racemase
VLNEPHNTERDTFYHDGDVLLPSPAPRFSRSAPSTPKPLGEPGTDIESVLRDWK